MLITQKDDPTFIVAEDNRQMTTEGWSLVDAVEAIKNVILVHLPR